VGNKTTEQARAKLDEARSLMTRALELLDEAEAPGQIGAYLDMAIGGLRAESGEEPEVSEEPGEQPSAAGSSVWPISHAS
jgi:hypothetical protein